jgi:uncharacterized repeat protein (TIGR03803 family)
MKLPLLRAAICLSAAFVSLINFTSPASAAVGEQVLYTFGTAGATPLTKPLVLSGKFYGTTSDGGGGCNCGTVYELAPKTGGGWTYTTLYTFKGGSDGLVPIGNIIADKKGNIYGVTGSGGLYKDGTVYKLSPGSGGKWKHTVIYTFGEATEDGSLPNSGLIMDAKGNLYGTTYSGGANLYDGTVYELSPSSTGWNETILHSFGSGVDGTNPEAELIMDTAGNLYGTTRFGGTGSGSDGTVFEMSPGDDGEWTETVLYNFTGGQDQGFPQAPVWMDAEGNLYGTTTPTGHIIFGTVYELTPGAGGTWTETTLHTFGQTQNDGSFPAGGVTSDGKGNLYGTTTEGGADYAGTVYELTQTDGTWTEQVSYTFPSGAKGGNPSTGLTLNGSNFLGVTEGGPDNGNTGAQVFYEIKP